MRELDLYELALCFLQDHFAYRGGINGDGDYTIGSHGRVGGHLDQYMSEYVVDLFGRDKLITIMREIHEYEYSENVIFAPDKEKRLTWLREECAKKLSQSV